MKKYLIGLSFATLSACSGAMFQIPDFRPAPTVPAPAPVAAPVVNPLSAKERFVTTVEQNGCVVNQANSAIILADATLSREDLARIMTELRAEGRGQIAADQQSFELISANCL
ncbi:hypothetical protein SAMN04488005_1763 [Yoonia tamlensis]|uniref:Lipoprotein n=1 Tax=Yoonia tamlensis TaxID=390270 RepID=A0A1I6GJM0_9RHOB|nr:hypothetical protein [Yoonia tamlensis]SFR42339.1 hypothetical protein SAMN04488005_1763 [Yoonia tamlensis]